MERISYVKFFYCMVDLILKLAATQTVRESLQKYEQVAIERAHEAGETLSWIVLDLSPVPEIDATAVHYWCVFALSCC